MPLYHVKWKSTHGCEKVSMICKVKRQLKQIAFLVLVIQVTMKNTKRIFVTNTETLIYNARPILDRSDDSVQIRGIIGIHE